MVKKEHQQLVRLINRSAGEMFRSAFAYDADSWSTLYIRNNVKTADLENSIVTLIRRAREHEPIIQEKEYGRLGEAQAHVELHNNGVLLKFVEEEREGVIVSLDREAARDLAGFIDRCNQVLNGP